MNLSPSTFSQATLIINILLALTPFYAAWINLSRRQISKFGFDALIFAIAAAMDKKHVTKARKDPKRIRVMGVMMLLVGIGAVYAVVTQLFEGF